MTAIRNEGFFALYKGFLPTWARMVCMCLAFGKFRCLSTILVMIPCGTMVRELHTMLSESKGTFIPPKVSISGCYSFTGTLVIGVLVEL